MPPTIAAVGGTDTVPMVNGPLQLRPWIESIRNNGVEAQLFINNKVNVDDCFHTLCKMPGTGGKKMTKQLIKMMRNEGVLNDDGSIIISLPAMQGVENPYERMIIDAYMGVAYLQDWPFFSFSEPMIDWIYQELSELQGGHRHTSDFDNHVLNLFMNQTEFGHVLHNVKVASSND